MIYLVAIIHCVECDMKVCVEEAEDGYHILCMGDGEPGHRTGTIYSEQNAFEMAYDFALRWKQSGYPVTFPEVNA